MEDSQNRPAASRSATSLPNVNPYGHPPLTSWSDDVVRRRQQQLQEELSSIDGELQQHESAMNAMSVDRNRWNRRLGELGGGQGSRWGGGVQATRLAGRRLAESGSMGELDRRSDRMHRYRTPVVLPRLPERRRGSGSGDGHRLRAGHHGDWGRNRDHSYYDDRGGRVKRKNRRHGRRSRRRIRSSSPEESSSIDSRASSPVSVEDNSEGPSRRARRHRRIRASSGRRRGLREHSTARRRKHPSRGEEEQQEQEEDEEEEAGRGSRGFQEGVRSTMLAMQEALASVSAPRSKREGGPPPRPPRPQPQLYEGQRRAAASSSVSGPPTAVGPSILLDGDDEEGRSETSPRLPTLVPSHDGPWDQVRRGKTPSNESKRLILRSEEAGRDPEKLLKDLAALSEAESRAVEVLQSLTPASDAYQLQLGHVRSIARMRQVYQDVLQQGALHPNPAEDAKSEGGRMEGNRRSPEPVSVKKGAVQRDAATTADGGIDEAAAATAPRELSLDDELKQDSEKAAAAQTRPGGLPELPLKRLSAGRGPASSRSLEANQQGIRICVDFAAYLPNSAAESSLRIAVCLYDENRPASEVQLSSYGKPEAPPRNDVEASSSSSSSSSSLVCMWGASFAFPPRPPSPHAFALLELQKRALVGRPQSIGWTAIPLFGQPRTPLALLDPRMRPPPLSPDGDDNEEGEEESEWSERRQGRHIRSVRNHNRHGGAATPLRQTGIHARHSLASVWVVRSGAFAIPLCAPPFGQRGCLAADTLPWLPRVGSACLCVRLEEQWDGRSAEDEGDEESAAPPTPSPRETKQALRATAAQQLSSEDASIERVGDGIRERTRPYEPAWEGWAASSLETAPRESGDAHAEKTLMPQRRRSLTPRSQQGQQPPVERRLLRYPSGKSWARAALNLSQDRSGRVSSRSTSADTRGAAAGDAVPQEVGGEVDGAGKAQPGLREQGGEGPSGSPVDEDPAKGVVPGWDEAPDRVEALPVVDEAGVHVPVPPAWIKYQEPARSRVQLDAGDGFDVYVDGARFLPDNVSITKVVFKALSPSYEVVSPEISSVALLDSELLCPSFDAYAAIRQPFPPESARPRPPMVSAWDPTMTLVFRVDTLESHTHKTEVVGYATLNVFTLDRNMAGLPPNTVQPTDDSPDDRIRLNAGCFQLALFQGPPDRKRLPLTGDALRRSGVPPVPCASLLVRIVPVRKDSTGVAPTRRDVPQSRWQSAGLAAPPPSYASGRYDSLRALPSVDEVRLFPKRADLSSPTLRQTLALFAQSGMQGADGLPDGLRSFGVPPPPESDDDTLYAWMARRLAEAPRHMVPFSFLAPFDMDLGFLLSIDGVHNVDSSWIGSESQQRLPSRAIVVASTLASPEQHPGLWERPIPRSCPWYITSNAVPSSRISFPRFRDGFLPFYPSGFDPRLCLYLEVWSLPLTTGNGGDSAGEAERVGWAVLPVFDSHGEGYVRRGAFLLPIIVDEPPRDFWQRMEAEDDTVDTALLRYGKPHWEARGAGLSFSRACSSILVRMQDPQFERVLPVADGVYDTSFLAERAVDAFSLRKAMQYHNEAVRWDEVVERCGEVFGEELQGRARREIAASDPPSFADVV